MDLGGSKPQKGGCVTRARLPRYSDRKGGWTGGDKRTLFTFTDKRTGQKWVNSGDRVENSAGPSAVTVRLATRAEALRMWQNPLHAGWKTSCPRGQLRRGKLRR